MRPDPSYLWARDRVLGPVPYLLVGVGLFAVKFALDWLIATQGFGRSWSPWDYVVWPNDRTLRIHALPQKERLFALTLVAASLPFIWAGVAFTLARLRSAGLPRLLVTLFFVPLVNLLLFLVLSLVPARVFDVREEPPEPDFADAGPLRRRHRRIVRDSYWRSGLLALAIVVPLCVGAVALGAQVLQSYGYSLFVGGPFILGLVVVLLFGLSRPQPFWACMLLAFAAATLAGVAVLVVALEGLICLIMAAPIAYALAFFGALVGYAIQYRAWADSDNFALLIGLPTALPLLMAAELIVAPEPELREVRTEVVIDASPARVWPAVLAFPPLAEPDELLFRCGVAYPIRAEIHGHGPGAVRHCVFSTGPFVEPIEEWDEPKLLRFAVTEQPEPMREWTPYSIHPPHLHGYLESRRGQFLLEELPGGRTRLVGTTWYSNRMWPAAYWGLWSDTFIQCIHGRVLRHIKAVAERGD